MLKNVFQWIHSEPFFARTIEGFDKWSFAVIVKKWMSALTREAEREKSCSCWPGSKRGSKTEINSTVEALGRIKTAPWWLHKTQLHLRRTSRVVETLWVERHDATVPKWETGGNWEEVMSWVMGDRVGQSEHHYSAGFFFLTKDYFSTAVRHFVELFTSLSVGIWRKAMIGCKARLHLMLKNTSNENHRDFMKHEHNITSQSLESEITDISITCNNNN